MSGGRLRGGQVEGALRKGCLPRGAERPAVGEGEGRRGGRCCRRRHFASAAVGKGVRPRVPLLVVKGGAGRADKMAAPGVGGGADPARAWPGADSGFAPGRDQGVRGKPGHGRGQRRAGESLQLLRAPENRVDREEPAGVCLRGV